MCLWLSGGDVFVMLSAVGERVDYAQMVQVLMPVVTIKSIQQYA